MKKSKNKWSIWTMISNPHIAKRFAAGLLVGNKGEDNAGLT